MSSTTLTKTVCLLILLAAGLSMQGCSALLPKAWEDVKSPWENYGEVQAAFDRVIPNKTTTHEMRGLGFDIYSTPNVRILNYIDIATSVRTLREEELDGGLQACLNAKNDCRGYEFAPQSITRKRFGNFWLDLFNFKRRTSDTGWRFKALFVVVHDTIVYKLSGGSPMINELRETKNPLGPLQDAGGILLRIP